MERALGVLGFHFAHAIKMVCQACRPVHHPLLGAARIIIEKDSSGSMPTVRATVPLVQEAGAHHPPVPAIASGLAVEVLTLRRGFALLEWGHRRQLDP